MLDLRQSVGVVDPARCCNCLLFCCCGTLQQPASDVARTSTPSSPRQGGAAANQHADASSRPTMSTKPPEPAAVYHGGSTGPGGGPAGGVLHAFPLSRPLPTDAIYNPSALYAAAAAHAYIPFGSSESSAFYPALVTVSR